MWLAQDRLSVQEHDRPHRDLADGAGDPGRLVIERQGESDQRGHRLRFALSPHLGAVRCLATNEHSEWEDEGHHHEEGRGQAEQCQSAPHVQGSANFTPTPWTVCRYRGSWALSPSFLRSMERWTSMVCSEPP